MGFYNNSTEVANTNEASSFEQHLSGTRRSSHQTSGKFLFCVRINYRLDLRIHELETQLQVRDARIADYQKQMRAPTTLQKVITLPNAGDGETLS